MSKRGHAVYHRHVEAPVVRLNTFALIAIMFVAAVVVATVLATVPK